MNDPYPTIIPIRDASVGFGWIPSFTGLVKGPLWRLESPWSFTLRDHTKQPFTIPAGYEFDKASIPPILWGPPFDYIPDGLCTVPALEHDFLCDLLAGGSPWLFDQLGTLPPSPPAPTIHLHFYIRLTEQPGMRPSKARAMYTAVRNFGPGGRMRPSSWFTKK